MNYLNELSKVYDKTIHNRGFAGEELVPIYHIKNNAKVTILLDENGNFIKAEYLEKSLPTIMPCTEECSARSSNISPYPLCDKLEYISADYYKYFSSKGSKKNDKYESYKDLLFNWSTSCFSNKKIESVYHYIKKGRVIEDLLENEIISLNKNGDIEEKLDGFIRWRVKLPNEKSLELWHDSDTQKKWINYCCEKSELDKDFCYVTGVEQRIAKFHGSKVRGGNDKAKIISSNDTSNFTFRGRFVEIKSNSTSCASQACCVGSLVSQKAHSALRWLISKQGTQVGTRLTLVCWNNATINVPLITSSGLETLSSLDQSEIEENFYSTEANFAMNFNRMLKGFCGNVQENEKIMIMCVDSGSTGRLSVVLYRQFSKTDFASILDSWHSNLAWYFDFKEKNKSWRQIISSPSLSEIAKIAYGINAKEKLLSKTIERLLYCLIESKVIPCDIEKRCFLAASNLLSFADSREENIRNRVLNTACAVIKYNMIKKNPDKEIIKVGLDRNRTNRDYLFGRLLALAHLFEEEVLKEKGVKRDTNAIRYMQRFSQRPTATWKLLYEKMIPYRKTVPYLSRYEKEIRDVSFLFDVDDFISDKPLSGEYLLAFQCQQKEWFMKQETKKVEV